MALATRPTNKVTDSISIHLPLAQVNNVPKSPAEGLQVKLMFAFFMTEIMIVH